MVTGYRIFCVLVTVFLSLTIAIAQIPNSGFENWTNGEPDGWVTMNSPPSIITITQTSSAHSGSSAAHGVAVSVGGFYTAGPYLVSGKTDTLGFPVNQQYPALHGYYKFTSVGGDGFTASILFHKDTTGVGVGTFIDTTTVTTWREFVAPIYYYGGTVPDTALIMIYASPLMGTHVGTTFDVDDLSFGPATGVNDLPNGLPKSFRLEQNFPNPFNPTTGIVYDLAERSSVQLAVYNLIGQQVATLVNEVQPAGRYKAVFDASMLPSGMYFYQLRAGNFSETKKMMLVK